MATLRMLRGVASVHSRFTLCVPRRSNPWRLSQTFPRECIPGFAETSPTLTKTVQQPRLLQNYVVRLPGCCGFHTSPRRHIHPILWVFLKPAAKLTSLMTGRVLRKKWQKLDEKEKAKVRGTLWNFRGMLGLVAVAGVSALVINYFTHLQATPMTGRVRYLAFTNEQFRKIADYEFEMHREANKNEIVSHDHPVYNKVISVAQQIVDANKDIEFFRDQTWTLWVIENTEPNAMVLPNGHMFVHTGILEIAKTRDQLAVILGHEMAHAYLSHAAEQVGFVQVIDWIIILTLAFLWFFIPSDGIALVTQWFYNKVVQLLLHLPYSRKLELEADQVGLQLIAKACFDVRESVTFWSLMQLLTEHGQSEFIELPQWLSTHPSNETRVESFNELIPKAIDMRKFCNCRELPRKDPRDAVITIKKVIVKDVSENEKDDGAKGKEPAKK